jgi:hypothetical protein
MKYIKSYEENSDDPQIGDYVICKEENDLDSSSTTILIKNQINEFLTINIGQIAEYDGKWYEVEYHNIPKNVDGWFHASKLNCRSMKRHEIIHYAKTKEELKPLINQIKYNL